MKLLKYLFTIVISSLVTGCNSDLDTISNGIYIEEASPVLDDISKQIKNVVIDAGNVQLGLTVRLNKPYSTDVSVMIETSQDILDKYNEEYQSSYEILPAEYWSVNSHVTIPAGSVSAKANLTVLGCPSDGHLYALPFKIVSEDGNLATVGNGDHLLYLLSAPHRQHSAIFTYGALGASVNINQNLPNWTIEYWVKWDDNSNMRPTSAWDANASTEWRKRVFPPETQPIGGISNLTFLFYPLGNEDNTPNMQFKASSGTMGNTRRSSLGGFYWPREEWVHLAIVYDGNEFRTYANGEVQPFESGETLSAGDKDFSNWAQMRLAIQGSNATYNRYTKLEMAQVRLWGKALSLAEIKLNMSKAVAPDSESLVGYWPCDEADGTVLHDVTANGNHISSPNVKWSDNDINFSSPNE